MDKIIDIEKLAQMPITKEFAELLFGDNAEIKTIPNAISVTYESKGIRIYIYENGMIENPNLFGIQNAFQIVRYIDNYLNSLK